MKKMVAVVLFVGLALFSADGYRWVADYRERSAVCHAVSDLMGIWMRKGFAGVTNAVSSADKTGFTAKRMPVHRARYGCPLAGGTRIQSLGRNGNETPVIGVAMENGVEDARPETCVGEDGLWVGDDIPRTGLPRLHPKIAVRMEKGDAGRQSGKIRDKTVTVSPTDRMWNKDVSRIISHNEGYTFVSSEQESEALQIMAEEGLMEMEPGALCKTYAGGTNLKAPEQLQEFLMNAKAVDQGYDTKAIKFDAKNIGRHPFGVAVWEGFLDAPVAGEFTFTVTGSGIQDDMSTIKNGKKLWKGFRPYMVSINGEECKGRGQYTFTATIKKGLNKVYIASGIFEGDSIKIEYRLTSSKKPAKPFTPQHLWHEDEEEEDWELKKNRKPE